MNVFYTIFLLLEDIFMSIKHKKVSDILDSIKIIFKHAYDYFYNNIISHLEMCFYIFMYIFI